MTWPLKVFRKREGDRLFAKLKQKSKALKADIAALGIALRHKRTPWYAKVVLALVVSYALSPVDLIPDFIPVLGWLDDLLLLPLGVALGIRMIPEDVWLECRQIAENQAVVGGKGWLAGGLIILIWIALLVLVIGMIA